MKFKKGDIVRFKSKTSRNAKYFKKGIDKLVIDRITPIIHVWESDKSMTWIVNEYELELDLPKSWRSKLCGNN